jgi:hypothetical protein
MKDIKKAELLERYLAVQKSIASKKTTVSHLKLSLCEIKDQIQELELDIKNSEKEANQLQERFEESQFGNFPFRIEQPQVGQEEEQRMPEISLMTLVESEHSLILHVNHFLDPMSFLNLICTCRGMKDALSIADVYEWYARQIYPAEFCNPAKYDNWNHPNFRPHPTWKRLLMNGNAQNLIYVHYLKEAVYHHTGVVDVAIASTATNPSGVTFIIRARTRHTLQRRDRSLARLNLLSDQQARALTKYAPGETWNIPFFENQAAEGGIVFSVHDRLDTMTRYLKDRGVSNKYMRKNDTMVPRIVLCPRSWDGYP